MGMISRREFASGIAFAACRLPLGFSAAGPFEFRELNPASLELRENGKPALVYNHGMILKDGVAEQYRRSSYLHPLYAPDGTVLTEDFPQDHPHHRGIFWSWPIVRFENQTYDVWALQGMHQRFVRWVARRVLADHAFLAVENGWFVGQRKAVKEIVEITVHPSISGRRQFEVKLTFEALDSPVEISGREIKGYGGFGIRFAPRIETVLKAEAGVEAKDSDMVRHPWVELTGVFEGHHTGVRVEDDSRNPGSPVGWCLRHYGYLGANFPGLDPVTLRTGKPMVLVYRVTVFSIP